MGRIIKLYEKDFHLAEKFLEDNFSSPTHYQEWNMVVSKHFMTDFFYFAHLEGDKITGVCPVHRYKSKEVRRIISGPKEFLIPYGGWIFNKTTKVSPLFFPIRNNENLEIYSLPLLKEFNSVYEGIKLLKNYKTVIIDLSKSTEEIWNNLDQKRRNMIRKAVKSDVEILYLQPDNLKEFYSLYSSANNDYGLDNMPYGYFSDLLSMAENINIDIIAAESENSILGYNVILSDKNYSIYWLGIRRKDADNNGFFDLMQWECIKKAKERNCRYFDLCYVEKEKLPNIYKFKTDYSKDEFDVLNLNKKSFIFRLGNKLSKLF